jgi:diguanylate cyclase (GGDEF)-like protein
MIQTIRETPSKCGRRAVTRPVLLYGIDQARREGRSFAVLVVDLDRFRRVNDAFGGEAGDQVLRDAATRIGRCIRNEDIVSRLGGDEFAVFFDGAESPASAAALADSIRAELDRPFLLAKGEVYVSASIGIAFYPGDGESADELVRRADLAMSQAKKAGGDHHQFYLPGSETLVAGRLVMEARLRRALKLGELEVYYQPQASLADGTTNSVEALVRWNDRELGGISPAQFIPLAEETGLIHAIGAWVLRIASAQAKAWQDAGLTHIRMCVNVSASQLNHRLVQTVSRVLAQTGLAPATLELEITESVMVMRDSGTEAALRALRALGIGFALDDFGTGYATFDYLKRLPVRTLKLDGSFVRGVCDRADDAAIIAASVSLARSLGIRTVAEGVETPEQRERLRELGCDDCQGYAVCRPLPAQALDEFLGRKTHPRKAKPPRLACAK